MGAWVGVVTKGSPYLKKNPDPNQFDPQAQTGTFLFSQFEQFRKITFQRKKSATNHPGKTQHPFVTLFWSESLIDTIAVY